jgi:hypothetical protein
MNELELVTALRAEVPLTDVRPDVDKAVMTAIRTSAHGVEPGSMRSWRRAERPPVHPIGRPVVRRLRLAVACLVASAVAAAGPIGFAVTRGSAGPAVIAWSGRPMAPASGMPYRTVGRARTAAQLVDYATRLASAAPVTAPAPHDWIYVKAEYADSTAGSGGFLFGPPNRRYVSLQWVRADWREYAGFAARIPASLAPQAVVRGQLQFSAGSGGTLGGWKSVSYSYLNSLPTVPAKLEAAILADNNPRMPWYVSDRNAAIFNAISTLLMGQLEGVWVPPKLAATMYRALQTLPGVHFDSATDLAGRTGLGFYLVIGGWYKQELVINPVTYSYMGDLSMAIRAHKSVATDGTRWIAKGQVLGWEALLESAVVTRPGKLP